MTAESATASAGTQPGFGSLSAMRASHQRLLKVVANQLAPATQRQEILAFLAEGTQTGATIESQADRAAAQALLDYWVGVLYSAPQPSDRSTGCSVPDALLTDFLPETLSSSVAMANEAYGRLASDEDRRLIRAVFLELVRPVGGGEVVGRPVRRETLQRLGDPAAVDRVLGPWVAAGIIAETRTGEPADDRFELTHKGLARDWGVLAGWLAETRLSEETRLRLTATAKLWKQSGADGYLLSGSALDEAARFAESGSDIESLVRASREKQGRDLERRALIRRRAIAVLLVLCAALAVMTGIARNERSKAEANARELERQQRLVRTVQIVRTLAEIGTARTDEWRTVAKDRGQTLLDQIRADELTKAPGERYFTNFIDNLFVGAKLNDVIEHAKKRADMSIDVARKRPPTGAAQERGEAHWYTSDEWKHFNKVLSIKVARKLRNDLINEDDEIAQKDLRGIRAVAYQRVRLCLNEMLKTFENQQFDVAIPYIREFWLNYWGDLNLVEGEAVERAMEEFGNYLRRVEDRLPRVAMEDGLNALIQNVNERELWPRFWLDLLAALPWPEKIGHVFRKYSRMVYRDERDRLKGLAEQLLVAMEKEKDEPIARSPE